MACAYSISRCAMNTLYTGARVHGKWTASSYSILCFSAWQKCTNRRARKEKKPVKRSAKEKRPDERLNHVCMCVCVCVCAWGRERERERERERGRGRKSNWGKDGHRLLWRFLYFCILKCFPYRRKFIFVFKKKRDEKFCKDKIMQIKV